LFSGMDFQMILILAFAGFLASFVDSMLGAFVEPHLDKMDYFIKGTGSESISPNDVVNVLASFTAPLFVLLLNFFLN